MSQSKSGSGSVIVAVIVLGAAYVCYSMFLQTQDDSSSMPSVIPSASKLPYVETATNPYMAALMAPRKSGQKIEESVHFSQLLHKTLPLSVSTKTADISSVKQDGDLLTKKDPLTGMSVLEIARKQDMQTLLEQIEEACEKGDSDAGLALVKQALLLADSAQGAEIPPSDRIDILYGGGRLSLKARDFDQSRQDVEQAIALAHKNHDYKMDYLEGLRCVLVGNGNEATDFNTRLSQFNQSLSQNDYAALPALADALIKSTAALPEDSFFHVTALQCKATSMLLTNAEKGQTEACIKKAEALAQKSQDQPVVANCEGLLARLQSKQ